MKSERKSKGMSAEAARAVLAKNPKLREHGRDTNWVQERVEKAWGERKEQAAAPGDFFELVQTLKGELARLEQEFMERERTIARERARAVDVVRQTLVQWLDDFDPTRTAALTKRVIERERAFFGKLGGSVE